MTESYLLGMQCLDVACLYWDGFSCFLFQIKYENYVQRMLPLLSQQSSCKSLFGPLATQQKFQAQLIAMLFSVTLGLPQGH